MNHELKLFVQWLGNNKLSLNEAKINYAELIMFSFSRKHLPRDSDI